MTWREFLDADWRRLSQLQGRVSSRGVTSYFHPRFSPVVLVRFAHALFGAGWVRCSKLVALLNFILFGIEVPASLPIGAGLIIMHTQGTVLGGKRIGVNCTLYHQVTLGEKQVTFEYNPEDRPVVGDNVTIFAGAKIIGAVTIGDHAVVGANAVVLMSVEAGKLAVGVPAVCKPMGQHRGGDRPT